MLDEEKTVAVLDLNVLSRGIIELRSDDLDILSFIEQGLILMCVTSKILVEYHNIFSHQTTDNHKPIDDSHRKRLKEILSFAYPVNSRHETKQLNYHEINIKLKDMTDKKYIEAAGMAVTINGLCHLISNDYHLTSIPSLLIPANIHVVTSAQFLGSPALSTHTH